MNTVLEERDHMKDIGKEELGERKKNGEKEWFDIQDLVKNTG